MIGRAELTLDAAAPIQMYAAFRAVSWNSLKPAWLRRMCPWSSHTAWIPVSTNPLLGHLAGLVKPPAVTKAQLGCHN